MRSKLGRGRESYGSDESGEEERVERLMKAKGGELAEREGRCGLWLGCNNCVCVCVCMCVCVHPEVPAAKKKKRRALSDDDEEEED